jgi:hypothetical protein
LELVELLCMPQEIWATIHARVFEDNNGAYLLAMTHLHYAWRQRKKGCDWCV